MKKLVFLCVVFLLAGTGLKAQTDSLRIERDGGKVLVIHKVVAKQTLFSLARRYGTTVDAINKENPSLTNGLQIGQVLKIPYGKALLDDTNNITHTVVSGETLFAIASKYGVQLDDIKNLNNLSSNSLSVGQVLVIEKKESPTSETGIPTIGGVQGAPQNEISVVMDSSVIVTVETPEVQVIIPDPSDELSSSPFKELLEEGIAELIEEGEASTKFLALHRTAPTGTVIKIRNTMNDLTVYVRVIGKLPDTGDNEKVIIKINKRTYDQLKALDNRFLVELSYFL